MEHLSILIVNRMLLKFYKFWLMSWRRISGGRHQLTCLCCHIQEEKFEIRILPLTSSVPESIKTFLVPEELTGVNRWFCPPCIYLPNRTKEIKFIKVGTIVILQLVSCLTGKKIFLHVHIQDISPPRRDIFWRAVRCENFERRQCSKWVT